MTGTGGVPHRGLTEWEKLPSALTFTPRWCRVRGPTWHGPTTERANTPASARGPAFCDWPTPFPTIGLVRSRVSSSTRPYGRNSHDSMANDPLLEASLRSARDVAHPDAGFVLILPVHPPTEHTTDALPLNHPLALLNGDWSPRAGAAGGDRAVGHRNRCMLSRFTEASVG